MTPFRGASLCRPAAMTAPDLPVRGFSQENDMGDHSKINRRGRLLDGRTCDQMPEAGE